MTGLANKGNNENNNNFLDIAENLLLGLKDIKKKQDSTEKRLDNLEQVAEISTTQRYIIKDKVKQIVNLGLKKKTRSHIGVAYSTVYRDMRAYGLAQPLGFTQKRDFDRIVEALNSYNLDYEKVEKRVEEIKNEQ